MNFDVLGRSKVPIGVNDKINGSIDCLQICTIRYDALYLRVPKS